MSKSAKYWTALAVVAVLQIGFLAKMAFDRVSLIKNGREIALQVIPIDPRDLFRGEYVILGYDISQISASKGGSEKFAENLPRRALIYVTLTPGAEGAWVAKELSVDYPKTVAPSDVVMKGYVRATFRAGNEASDTVAIRYGIESYFVPEGTGKALEQSVRDKKIQALVAVANDGTAALKGLVIGGERHEDPPLL